MFVLEQLLWFLVLGDYLCESLHFTGCILQPRKPRSYTVAFKYWTRRNGSTEGVSAGFDCCAGKEPRNLILVQQTDVDSVVRATSVCFEN